MGQRRIAAMGLVARGPTEANLLAAVAAEIKMWAKITNSEYSTTTTID